MDLSDTTLQHIASQLLKTLSPAHRKEAENALLSIERQPNFALALLKLVAHPSIPDPHVKFSAAVYFKNIIKKYWKPDSPTEDFITAENRLAIKNGIVDLMITATPVLQLQLSDAVSIMADCDFPDNWQNLVTELANKLSPSDHHVNNGVLQTAHSIFKRWRGQFRTDRLFSEIKLVLRDFSAQYLAVFQATDAAIDAHLNDPTALGKLFNNVFLLFKIYQSLICQDLPEFIEDHHEQFMGLLKKYLDFKNAGLASDNDEPGVLEKVKTCICEIISDYASRYEEDFPKLPVFVESVWTLLVGTTLDAKYDMLVSKAIGFLTSVVKPARHRELFANEAILTQICQNIVLPNMSLRESDEELFEDDPIEFIRRDLEGSDTDTRRRAASDLVRGLLEQFEAQVTSIFGNYVSAYLENYQKNKAQNWKSKDTALYLLMSLSAKGVIAQAGATQLNALIPQSEIFQNHILPDLQEAVDGACHSVIKVDVIKYILMFRTQVPNISTLMPLIVQHLASENYIVYTYASICIEKCLTTRMGDKPLITSTELKSFASTVLSRLFDILAKSAQVPQKLAENDYIMKTIMRVIAFNREETKPFADTVLTHLCHIVAAISKNPSNPKFNHFVFESLSALIKFVPGKDPSMVEAFETQLTPLIMSILQQDIAEFVPYAVQLMSQLLVLHPQAGLPSKYQALLPSFLVPAPWENHSNVPGLVKLMKAYIRKGAAPIAQSNQLPSFLGICQKLISSRMNDHYGFELLGAIFEFMPSDVVTPFLKGILTLLVTRLSGSKTAKFSKGFLKFICFLFTLQKPGLEPDVVVNAFHAIQPNLFMDLLGAVLIPEIAELMVPEDRRLCIVGFTLFMTKSTAIRSHTKVGTDLLHALGECALAGSVNLTSSDLGGNNEAYLQDVEEAGYQAGFAKLAAADDVDIDYTKNFPDSKLLVKNAVMTTGLSVPFSPLVAQFLQS